MVAKKKSSKSLMLAIESCIAYILDIVIILSPLMIICQYKHCWLVELEEGKNFLNMRLIAFNKETL